ncbi:MAG: 50S ribosomal protein L3 [Planctomycetes bacterium]|nr:50S ribosomal protein L3 [Planctomycetota bacterium]
MPVGILGRKIGMTQVFDDETGDAVPVTIIEAGPCSVLQVKTKDTDGYNAVQLGFGEMKEKHSNRPMMGHFAAAGVSPARFVREIRMSEAPGVERGATLTVQILEGVSKVDVRGVSKGKGWAGVMKRWNFQGQRASHGNTKHHRMPGSIGRTYSTSKGVPKGFKMAGQMGNRNVTVRGLELVRIIPEDNLLVVKGSIPGPNDSFVIIHQSQKDSSFKP